MAQSDLVVVNKGYDNGKVWLVQINRPKHRNAVNQETAKALSTAFIEFERDATACVAVLHGIGGNFCAGADLKAIAQANGADMSAANKLSHIDGNLQPEPAAILDETGPMGISRLVLSKPVIAAVSGYAVAGGLELACWCDMRVADDTAVFGVFCRRFGVPLIDGGTVRLPLLIGQSRAMDMILTGRAVAAEEALSFGLANRLVKSDALSSPTSGNSLPNVVKEALQLASDIAAFPQGCMRADRLGVIFGAGNPTRKALSMEFELGVASVLKEGIGGAQKFAAGVGRHGVATSSSRAKL